MIRRLSTLVLLLASFATVTLAQYPPTNGPLHLLPNNTSTGTVANKLITLDASGNAIVMPTSQTTNVQGVALYGAGTSGNVYYQWTGTVAIIADGTVAVDHWVIPSTTTAGDIHDTGTACTSTAPSGVDVVGCSQTAGGGAALPAIVALRTQYSASGVTGTASTNCTIKGSGTNTISCGAGSDTGTLYLPQEILDIQTYALAFEHTTAAGTYNTGNLACLTATQTVGDCPSAAGNINAIGINIAKNGSTPVTQIQGRATVNSSASVVFTAGDVVCTDSANAAKVVDNSTTPCPIGSKQVGTVATTDGGATAHTIDLNMDTVPQSSSPVYTTLTDGATITWTVTSQSVSNATVTLGGARTLAITGATSGWTGTLIVKEDATGGRSLALPSGSKVVGGGGGAITLTSTPNAIDIITVTYDGTNYWFTFGKNFT